jgi:hypothetical protein
MEKSLNWGGTGVGDSEFRVLEVLLPLGLANTYCGALII